MSVSEFFFGQIVFLTGCTGSVGSVLLEKMLRSCPGVDTIYVLIRPKTGHTTEERLARLLKSPLFSNLEAASQRKVQAISGDVTLPNLGLDVELRRILCERVTLVLHSAAKVIFNASLKDAAECNLLGTRRVLDLCQQMDKLQSLVYVSTAYCNNTPKDVTERLYPIQHDPLEIMSFVDKCTAEELTQEVTERLLGSHPNTYTFSKQLAEHYLSTQRGDIKLAIVRPSVVLGTWKEPFPGWLDSSNGASGFMAGAGKGIFRTSQAKPNRVADLIPADLVVNAILAAAWSLSQPGAPTMQVYHVTSGTENPITWGKYTRLVVKMTRKFPCAHMLWYPGAACRGSLLRNAVVVRLFQLWPAYLIDALRLDENRKKGWRSLVFYQSKFLKGMEHTSFFTMRQWRFHCTNTKALAKQLLPEDRHKFPLDVREVRWPEFIEHCVRGIRQHFHRDPPHTLERARRNLRRWKAVHVGAHLLLFAGVALVLATVFATDPLSFYLSCLVFAVFFLWL